MRARSQGHAQGQSEEDEWWPDSVFLPVEASDHLPVFTGLYSADGVAILRIPRSMGFGVDIDTPTYVECSDFE